MTIYVDASALACSFVDRPDSPAWRAWEARSRPDFATSAQVITQLRAEITDQAWEVRERALDYLEGVEVLRISDSALKFAAFAHGVLLPFEALSIGIARASEEVVAFATYERQTAAVAHLHGLKIISPGRAEMWWE